MSFIFDGFRVYGPRSMNMACLVSQVDLSLAWHKQFLLWSTKEDIFEEYLNHFDPQTTLDSIEFHCMNHQIV